MKKLFFLMIATLGTMSLSAQPTLISSNDLPADAQKFLTENFKEKVEYVKKDNKFFDEYEVRLADGTEIEFDSKGNWKEVESKKNALPTGFIPAKIQKYAADKFPNTHIKKIERGVLGKYEVKLSNGLELEFNSDGDFKRIDD
jgi:hypothetical protein